MTPGAKPRINQDLLVTLWRANVPPQTIADTLGCDAQSVYRLARHLNLGQRGTAKIQPGDVDPIRSGALVSTDRSVVRFVPNRRRTGNSDAAPFIPISLPRLRFLEEARQ